MVGKTGLSQAGGVGGFQYGGHNARYVKFNIAGGTEDNDGGKDLLVHQYIAREGGSIALADVAWQGGLQHYEEQ